MIEPTPEQVTTARQRLRQYADVENPSWWQSYLTVNDLISRIKAISRGYAKTAATMVALEAQAGPLNHGLVVDRIQELLAVYPATEQLITEVGDRADQIRRDQSRLIGGVLADMALASDAADEALLTTIHASNPTTTT